MVRPALSTIQHVEHTLHRQKSKLAADPYFELGDAPNILNGLQQELEDLLARVKLDLGEIYTLEQNGLGPTNRYYKVVGDLSRAIELLKSIRRAGSGSINNTEVTLALLNQCLEDVQALADQAGIKTFPHEVGLKCLQQYLNELKPEHPARNRFDELSSHLRQAWQSDADRSVVESIFSDLDDLSLSLTNLKFQALADTGLPHGNDDSLIIAPQQSIIPIENCWAVLAGVSRHTDTAYGYLPHAANDAYELAKVLLMSGAHGYAKERSFLFISPQDSRYDVEIEVCEPQFLQIFQAVIKTAQRAGPNDLLLFYFSGHGLLSGGVPYLICQDTSEIAIGHTALQMSEMKRYIQNSDAKVKIIILDTCHAGAILGPDKAVDPMQEDYIRLVSASAAGTVIMMSCRAGERSFPLENNQLSVFTHYLIEGIQKGGLRDQSFVTAHGLNSYVSQGVKWWSIHSESGRLQTPLFWCNLEGGDPIIIDWNTEIAA